MSKRVPGRVGRVHQVNVSQGGVPKLPVGRARVHRLGLEGDGHNEPEPIHGGPDAAVSLYCVTPAGTPGCWARGLSLPATGW